MHFDAVQFLGPLVAWPLLLLVAWIAGEWVFRRWQLPRVCAYGAVGLALSQLGVPQHTGAPGVLGFGANVALALALFELGYRVNPRWFRHNPWVLGAGLAQAALTFGAVYGVAGWFDVGVEPRRVLAAVCVASSPAAVMRVTHELRSAGQVTERLLHLCALNCLIAVLLLKGVVGHWQLATRGDLGMVVFNSAYVIGLPLVLGAVFGAIAPLLNRVASSSQSTTVTFAFLVLLLTGVAQSLHLSPLLAALAFGLVARERRVMLSHAQRNFGVLGDALTVWLFVYIGSLLAWPPMLAGLLLGGAVLVARTAAHTLVNVCIARVSGTTVRKGALTGLALMPMAAFALLLLEESRVYGVPHDGFDLARDSLPLLVGLLVLLDVIGPLVTQSALRWAGEAQPVAA